MHIAHFTLPRKKHHEKMIQPFVFPLNPVTMMTECIDPFVKVIRKEEREEVLEFIFLFPQILLIHLGISIFNNHCLLTLTF